MNDENKVEVFLVDVLEQLSTKVPSAAFVVQMVQEDASRPGFVSVHTAVTDNDVIPMCIKSLVDNFTAIHTEPASKADKH